MMIDISPEVIFVNYINPQDLASLCFVFAIAGLVPDNANPREYLSLISSFRQTNSYHGCIENREANDHMAVEVVGR